MKQVISLLIVLVILFTFGCSKELNKEPESITGEVYKIDEIVAEEDVEEVIEKIEENITTVRLCHDTDNGMVRWVEGKIFGFYSNATRFEFEDYCQNFNYLIEFYCENEDPKQQIFLCRNGCEDNHCQ